MIPGFLRRAEILAEVRGDDGAIDRFAVHREGREPVHARYTRAVDGKVSAAVLIPNGVGPDLGVVEVFGDGRYSVLMIDELPGCRERFASAIRLAKVADDLAGGGGSMALVEKLIELAGGAADRSEVADG